MAGRPPKPISLLKAQGTYRPDRHANKPSFDSEAPAPPRKLTKTEAAVWDRYVELFHGRGTLSAGDGPALLLLVETEIEMGQQRKALKETGLTYDASTPDGGKMIRKHPMAQIYENTRRQFAGLLVQFGGTPSSATKVKIAKQKPEASKWDQIDRAG
jgi:P27 family predicted phage terminase small subunit